MARKTRNLFCISIAMFGALLASHLFASNALPGARSFTVAHANARAVEAFPDFRPLYLRDMRREAPSEIRAISIADLAKCAPLEGIAPGRCEPERIALFTRARDYRSAPQDGSRILLGDADRTPQRAPRACPKIPTGGNVVVDPNWLVELGVCDVTAD